MRSGRQMPPSDCEGRRSRPSGIASDAPARRTISLAAAEAKGWRYEDVGQCHLEKRKKRFATELDAQIFTWLQRKKHGGERQRAYPCDGSDAGDGSGCGSWHLTSKAAFS